MTKLAALLLLVLPIAAVATGARKPPPDSAACSSARFANAHNAERLVRPRLYRHRPGLTAEQGRVESLRAKTALRRLDCLSYSLGIRDRALSPSSRRKSRPAFDGKNNETS